MAMLIKDRARKPIALATIRVTSAPEGRGGVVDPLTGKAGQTVTLALGEYSLHMTKSEARRVVDLLKE
jgi:hypothetical protein